MHRGAPKNTPTPRPERLPARNCLRSGRGVARTRGRCASSRPALRGVAKLPPRLRNPKVGAHLRTTRGGANRRNTAPFIAQALPVRCGRRAPPVPNARGGARRRTRAARGVFSAAPGRICSVAGLSAKGPTLRAGTLCTGVTARFGEGAKGASGRRRTRHAARFTGLDSGYTPWALARREERFAS